ncbi:MAG TPA: phosphate ABC transporter permease family protein, partial [Croceibacterium sp.]|nr:phosphate ABC transporter permease family protein [Croceibacterium sp.]
MSPAFLLLLALGLGLAGWLAARARAWSFRRAAPGTRLAALPTYHAWYVALWIAVPVLLFVLAWSAIAPQLVAQSVLTSPAAADLPAFGMQRETILGEARNVATGAAPAVFNPAARDLVEPYREAIGRYDLIGLAATLAIAFAGGAWSFLRIRPDFAARTSVERGIMLLLLLASLVAILTTLGIFVSLVFETVRFFGMVSPADFLFGTHWGPDPMSSSATPDPSRYGALPLFWGTIYIGAIIAMIVAIPLGMMSAIYLTQYARPKARKVIKPA